MTSNIANTHNNTHHNNDDEETLPSYAEATTTLQIPASILKTELAGIHKTTSSLGKIRRSSSSFLGSLSSARKRSGKADEGGGVDEDEAYDDDCRGGDEIYIRERRRDKISAAILKGLTSTCSFLLFFLTDF